jgi:S1-C subfamily serine protease
VLNYGDRLEVASVLPGSGAARAGLRKGDALVAANGKVLPVGANAETLAAASSARWPAAASRWT